jgi:hypothetical protein
MELNCPVSDGAVPMAVNSLPDGSHDEDTGAIKEPSFSNDNKAEKSEGEPQAKRRGSPKREPQPEVSPYSVEKSVERKARTSFRKINEINEATKDFFHTNWYGDDLLRCSIGNS